MNNDSLFYPRGELKVFETYDQQSAYLHEAKIEEMHRLRFCIIQLKGAELITKKQYIALMLKLLKKAASQGIVFSLPSDVPLVKKKVLSKIWNFIWKKHDAA